MLEDQHSPIRSASFSPDDQRILTLSKDGTARVWKTNGAGTPVVLEGHEGPIQSKNGTWSPDSQRVLLRTVPDGASWVSSADGTGDPLALGTISSVSFSPDGRRILTVAQDEVARVWNADGSGTPVVLEGHSDPIEAASFSPDGQRVITGSGDGTARMWNADGSGPSVVLEGHQSRVWSASFSPDGQRIVTASGDKTVRVWTAWPTDGIAMQRRLEAASSACVPIEDRIRYVGESPEQACEAFAACERKHGRAGEC